VHTLQAVEGQTAPWRAILLHTTASEESGDFDPAPMRRNHYVTLLNTGVLLCLLSRLNDSLGTTDRSVPLQLPVVQPPPSAPVDTVLVRRIVYHCFNRVLQTAAEAVVVELKTANAPAETVSTISESQVYYRA